MVLKAIISLSNRIRSPPLLHIIKAMNGKPVRTHLKIQPIPLNAWLKLEESFKRENINVAYVNVKVTTSLLDSYKSKLESHSRQAISCPNK